MAKPKTTKTEIELIKKDIDYIKGDIEDIKRLQYWLLGIFATLFVFLIATVVGVAIR